MEDGVRVVGSLGGGGLLCVAFCGFLYFSLFDLGLCSEEETQQEGKNYKRYRGPDA